MRIGVTGPNGFIGRALVRRLAALGHEVVPLGRDRVALGAETRIAADALAGLDAIVHLAGIAHRRADDDAMQAVNADGTALLAAAAAGAGVSRLVYLSSLKVMGEASPAGPDGSPRALTEEDAPAPADAYGCSKLEAERALAEIAARTGLEAVVIRPPLVHGPGAKGNLDALMRAVAHGVPLPLGAVRNRRSLIGLDTLCDLIAVSLAHPAAPGPAMLVSDGEDVSTADLVRLIARGMGRRPRLLAVPPALLARAARMLGREAAAIRLFGSMFVDPEPAFARLGFAPRVSLAEGIARMAGAYGTPGAAASAEVDIGRPRD